MKSPLVRLMCRTQKLGDDHLQWPEKRWAALSDMVEVVKVGSTLIPYKFRRTSSTADKQDGVADCVMAHLRTALYRSRPTRAGWTSMRM